MRALWVTNMWPDRRRPWYGSFVHSQAESLRRLGLGLDVLYIPGYLSKGEYLRALGRLQHHMRSGDYDLVHAHYGYSGVIARCQVRAPLVISYCGDDLLGTPRHNGAPGFTRSSRALAVALAQLARVASATITKSDSMAALLPARARRRNRVIPNGVDVSKFKPTNRAEARQQLGWHDRRPNVLFVGDPAIPRKNVSLARGVCAELARRGRPVELRIAVDVPPAQMPLWLNAADLLLFPSLSEGSPNAVKEAMATELPIVSTPVGDVPERLRGVAGTFVVPHDVERMADAVLAALQVSRAPAAREAVLELSTERIAHRLLTVYQDVTV